MSTRERLYSKSVRISATEHTALTVICQMEGMPEAAMLRHWIRDGIARYKLSKAIEGYRGRNLTLSEAATLAEIPVREMMRGLAREGLPILHTDENFDAAIQVLAGRFGTPELIDALEQIRTVETFI